MKVELEQLEKLSYGKREAFNSLRTNLSFCGDDIKVIIFTSCTPDEGKSSTVMELGRSLSENGKKVLLIDGDVALRSLDLLLNLEENLVYYIAEHIKTKLLSTFEDKELVQLLEDE